MKYIILILFLGTACQSGLIPCPRVKTAKIKKSNIHNSFYESMLSLSAKNEDNNHVNNLHYKASKSNDSKAIKNVSVEDWDCPHPGAKKYLPKSVRENIKKNMKKIKSSSINKEEPLNEGK